MVPLLPALLGPLARYLAVGLLALAFAGALIGVGIRYERAQVLVAVARADKAEADAKRLAADAQASADAARKLASDNEAQALAYAADAEQARSDADRFAIAREAATIAAKACETTDPVVSDEVHRALTGKATAEGAPLPGSLKAAVEAIGTRRKGRHR